MPTKAELEQQLDDLKHDLRRSERALNQARLDLEQLDTNAYTQSHTTPALSPQTRQALDRAYAEWERVVVDPDARVDTYCKSREGAGWSWQADYTKNGQYAWCGFFAAFCHTAVKFPIRQKIFPSCIDCIRIGARQADQSNIVKLLLVILSWCIVVSERFKVITSLFVLTTQLSMKGTSQRLKEMHMGLLEMVNMAKV